MSPERKKLILALAVIFAVNIFIIALAQRASAELYKKGSGGAVVSEIQTRLKNWGYYNGDVDGVYGSRTEKAVRWFQQKNGLNVDGQVGDQTLAALGMSVSGESGGGSGGSGSLDLLARLISAEARGEPYEGQVAVGAVVLNRGWSIPLSPIRSRRSSTSPVPFRAWMTDSSTSPWPRAPTGLPRTP